MEDARAKTNIGKVINKMSGETYEEKLAGVVKCNCCVRHSKRKPQTLDDNAELSDKCNDYEIIASDGCKCTCRHLARVIVRDYQSTS